MSGPKKVGVCSVARGMSPAAIVGRTDICKRGHELIGDNVYRQPSKPTIRYCRACQRYCQQQRRVSSARVA